MPLFIRFVHGKSSWSLFARRPSRRATLFQSINSAGTEVTGRALNRYNACAAIRKRAKAAGFLTAVGYHTWRATGITIYLENDARLEHDIGIGLTEPLP
jgi:hypothetical protein